MRLTCYCPMARHLHARSRSGPSACDPEQTRILALESAWSRAEEQKDAKALDTLLASSLLYIDYDGALLNKAQFLQSMKAPSLLPNRSSMRQWRHRCMAISRLCPECTARKASWLGKAYLRRGRFIDTWINLNGTWQCVTSQP